MSADGAPKSSYELAMERLRRKDAEQGIVARTLTDDERAAIADVRSLYDSKIAEQHILQQAALKDVPAVPGLDLEPIVEPFRRERERLERERDGKVERIRQGVRSA